jgi:hypothetical protein
MIKMMNEGRLAGITAFMTMVQGTLADIMLVSSEWVTPSDY